MECAFDLIVGALEVKRLFAGPFLAHHAQVFVGAGVAFVLADVAAVGAQFAVVATRDDMHGRAPTVEHIQGGELARSQGGLGETGTVGDKELKFLGHAGGVGGDQCAVRAVGVEGHQCAVEAGFFVGAGHGLYVVGLQRRAAARVDFGSVMAANVADEFNAHGLSLCRA